MAALTAAIATSMAGTSGLRAEFAPIELPGFELSMVWRGVSHNHPGERWLRSRFSEFLSDNSRLPMAIAAA